MEKAKMIINSCISFYGFKNYEDFCKKDRHFDRTIARQVAAYLIKKNTGLSETDFYVLFNRDRTTCINSTNVIEGYLKVGSPEGLRDEMKKIMEMI